MRDGITIAPGVGQDLHLRSPHGDHLTTIEFLAQDATDAVGPDLPLAATALQAPHHDVLVAAGDDLAAKFEPIIANTTAQSQAVSRYEALTSRAKPMLAFVPGMNLDVNDYVTQQALDGLFAVIGQQEQKIRANPAAAGSAIAKKVFSTVSR